MKIIITGGAGFIGSSLSKKLLSEGHNLLIIDEMHPYYSVERKQIQLDSIKEYGEFIFHKKSLLHDEDELRAVFQSFQAECVIHLAAIPGVSLSLEIPNEYVDYDIKATINTLRMAGESGVKHVIFASSSSVYGEQEAIPLKEDMATGKVISPYAAAKYGAEAFCHAYAAVYGYQMTILRFFTVYGPYGRPDMAIYSFIHKLQKGEQIILYGEGTSRDYTYIDDCVEGIYCALSNAKGNETYNIGSGRPISLNEVINHLRDHFPSLNLKRENERLGDVSATWADTSKAKKMLGFEAAHSFSGGLAKTVAWMNRHEQ